jgi:5-methylcytosine-specific restriction protein B
MVATGEKSSGKIMSKMVREFNQALAEPFSQIFADVAEANLAFDFLLDSAKRLGLTSAYDERFALTLTHRAGKPGLHLNFGGWLILGFRAGGKVEMVLLAEQVAWNERLAALPFERKEGQPEIRSYVLPLAWLKPMTSDLHQAFAATLAVVADRFQTWKRASHWKQHYPEIVEALFDTEKRRQLLAGGLKEFLYERHLTAFYQDVSEEAAPYTVEAEPATGQALDPEAGAEVEEMAAESEAIPLNPPYPLPELAENTGLAEADLRRWLQAIERKGQAILYGPPGTGKTYLAEQLARHLSAGGDGFWELVQFHPAYAYEDFIQGIRPLSEGGQLSYPLLPGRFLDFCRRAGHRSGRCVLIIDEINRANLARVFGELMYVLEYREREVPLAGGGRLKLPGNVRLLGTMNTADRSIALVDHALRRRFAFIKLTPNYDLLRRYHQSTGFPVHGLIKTLQQLNQAIQDQDYAVGITFFLRDDLVGQLEDIWRMEIEPYLEEYFFGQPDRVESFRWAKIGPELLAK